MHHDARAWSRVPSCMHDRVERSLTLLYFTLLYTIQSQGNYLVSLEYLDYFTRVQIYRERCMHADKWGSF